MLNLTYKLSEWNPQFLRELKGRLKKYSILFATYISLFGQFVFFIYARTQLPPSYITPGSEYTHKYCTGLIEYGVAKCLFDSYGNIIINWQSWFENTFILLSTIGIFTTLVAGTYLLISDLATEARRDTLNFIRLSPQPPESILLGKMLGVPILLYWGALLATPLYLWLGINAKISFMQISIFYILFIASGFFYYSSALLFGLVGSWLGGFQSWLGTGAIAGFLFSTQEALKHYSTINYPFVVFRLINPIYFIPTSSSTSQFVNFNWFGMPLGMSFTITAVFAILINSIATYYVWQSLQRCYRDTNATMLSKYHSYLLTTSFTVITIGCTNWLKLGVGDNHYAATMKENLCCLMFLTFCLFLYLIAALTPNRQTLQDWARYRHISNSKYSGKGKLIKDLIWGEKSPGIVALAINGLISVTGLSLFVLIASGSSQDEFNGFVSLIFALSLALMYAALAQIVLLTKNNRRLFLTNGIVLGVIIFPPIILGMLFSDISKQTLLWLFSVAAPIIILYPSSGTSLGIMIPVMAILGHAGILGVLLSQITRQIKKVGESTTKAVLAGN